MDIENIRQYALRIRHDLKKESIIVDCVILFGSYARGTSKKGSDIDLAVISRDFGRDRFNEGILLNLCASKIHPDIEAVPVSLHDWFDDQPLSQVLHQVQKEGITVL